MDFDYDKAITEPKHDPNAEYANGRIDDMNTKEMIEFALKKGLLEDGLVFETIQQALYDYFYEEAEVRS